MNINACKNRTMISAGVSTKSGNLFLVSLAEPTAEGRIVDSPEGVFGKITRS